MEFALPGHQRSRQRTVNRILLRLIIAAGVLAVAWSTWSTRGTVARALRTNIESDTTELTSSLVEEIAAAGDSVDFTALIPSDTAARIAILQPDGEGELVCAATNEDEWFHKSMWRLDLLLSDAWTQQIEAADGTPVFNSETDRIGVAQHAENGIIVYADLGTASIQPAVNGATWGALFSALIRAIVIGGILFGLLWIRLARPIAKIATGGEALAQRNAESRLPLHGPDEFAKICSALNALASDCELERSQVDKEAARWRALFDEIPAAAFIFANSGRILEANRRAQEIFQADLDSLRQCDRSDLVTDDGSLQLGGGDLMPVHWVEAPMDHEGRPATFGAALDLREASSAKAELTHLARVLDAVDVMVVEVGSLGEITACNAETARWMSQPIDTIPGLPIDEAFDFQPKSTPWKEIARHAALQGSWKGDITVHDNSGCERTLQLLVTPLPAPGSGGIGRRLAVLHDVTELRSLRETLAKSGRLEQAGTVSAAMAQELHSQMAGLLAYTTYLRDSGQGSTEVNEGLASIEASGTRVKRMADHLLSHVRREVLRSRPTDLNRLVQEVAAGPEAMAASHVSITVETDSNLEPIPCDPDLMAKALRAILQNGLDAIRAAGSISFRTRAPRPTDDESSVPCALIEIHDTGEGLSPIAKPHATEMFFTTRDGHSGVGLSMAEGIVRLHGGELEIDGDPGKGTWVRVSLPSVEPKIDQEPERVSEIQAIVPPTQQTAAEESEGYRELISRDENDNVIEELFENVENDEEEPEEEFSEQEEMEFEEIEELQEEDGEEEEEEDLDEEDLEDEEEEDEEAIDEEDEESFSASDKPPVLLIVDDEDIVLDLVKDIFEDENYEIVTANGGKAAIKVMEERGESVFMALVDLSMPGMDGWEVAAALHEIQPELSIHIASGYSTEEEDIPTEVQHIVTGLVRKPFRAGKLRDLIEQELSRFA